MASLLSGGNHNPPRPVDDDYARRVNQRLPEHTTIRQVVQYRRGVALAVAVGRHGHPTPTDQPSFAGSILVDGATPPLQRMVRS